MLFSRWFRFGGSIVGPDTFGPALENRENVYGVELTAIGAIAAVSYHNGTTQHVATIEGSPAYAQLMESWYQHIANNISHSPYNELSWAETHQVNMLRRDVLSGSNDTWLDKFAYRLGWKKRDLEELYALDYYPNDEPTQVLTELFTELKTSISSKLNMTGQPDRPYIELALPAWFFSLSPVFPPDEPDPVFAAMRTISSKPLSYFTKRISTAAHRGGFRRAVEEDTFSIMDKIATGDRIAGPVAAPVAILEKVLLPDCSKERDVDGCLETRYDKASGGGVVVSLEGMGKGILASVWVDDMNDVWHAGARRGFEVLLAAQGGGDLLAARLMRLLERGSAMSESQLTIILTGSMWTETAIENLRGALEGPKFPFKLLQQSADQVALATAEEARSEYLSHWTCGLRIGPDDLIQPMTPDRQEL